MPAQRTCSRVVALGAFLTMLNCAMPAAADLPRLSVSADGRTFTKGDRPLVWLGDTAWRLQRLNLDEVDAYLADRRAKGFNVIQGPGLHSDTPDINGETNPDHANPNEAWFAHIDALVDRCAAHNMYIAPVLTWYHQAPQFTLESAFTYGQYVGARYRDRSNIAAFIVAGEFNHPAPNVDVWSAIAQGLQAGLAGAPVLITALPRWYGWWGGQSSSYDLHALPWLGFNMHQSSLYGDCSNDPMNLYHMGTHNWLLCEHDWPMQPARPFIDAEATYEDTSPLNPACQFNPPRWPAFGVRRRAYWSVFAGAAGHTYGANGVYQFWREGEPEPDGAPNDFWNIAIDFPGSTHMSHLHRLLRSRPMLGREPAQHMLLAGATELVPVHVQAMRAADGSFAMVYVPETSKTITIDLATIVGETRRLWWFDPATGQATWIADVDRRDDLSVEPFTITTPANGEDFVLVIDDVSRGFDAPGIAGFFAAGDVTGDEHVNIDDLLAVIAGWGTCNPLPAPCLADLDGDGTVDIDDLLLVISNWG